MKLMWIVIGAFVLLTTGKFFFDRWRMQNNIKKRGGMAVVYKQLVDLLLETFPGGSIIEERASYIFIGNLNRFFQSGFEIVSAFDDLVITYRSNTPLTGKVRLQWSFRRTDEPEYILFRIEKDIEAYFKNQVETI